MALTHCSECRRNISSRAAVCPYCGVPAREVLWGEIRCQRRELHYIALGSNFIFLSLLTLFFTLWMKYGIEWAVIILILANAILASLRHVRTDPYRQE